MLTKREVVRERKQEVVTENERRKIKIKEIGKKEWKKKGHMGVIKNE